MEELSKRIHGNLPSSTTVATPQTSGNSADSNVSSADRSLRPRKERSIDLDSADNVLDFLVDEGHSLRDYDEQHYFPNKVKQLLAMPLEIRPLVALYPPPIYIF